LTQHDYEEALMTKQTKNNPADDGIFMTEDKNRYNLRSKSDTSQHNTPSSPEKSTTPVKKKDQTSENQQTDPSKEKASTPRKKTVAHVKHQIPEI
jgi:hypothetical protein